MEAFPAGQQIFRQSRFPTFSDFFLFLLRSEHKLSTIVSS